ncbi:hypothetical protein OG422_31005 (plasmid) [Streptomyces sp. NBC_01525]|uniref:hypothetical protein n=1 Tax=Streptomyces sp. NBC_01525 TaxID=2903893 RepID=UPI00386AF49E
MAAAMAAATVLVLGTGGVSVAADEPPAVGRVVLAAPAAPSPDPKPSDSFDPCEHMAAPLGHACDDDPPSAGSGSSPLDPGSGGVLDPFEAITKSCTDGAAWVIKQLNAAVTATGDVDFTSKEFLQQYALVFAASTILTLLVWLWAVMTRAFRGVPFTTAFGEAIGFLWMAVLACAFTPLALHVVTAAADGVAAVLAKAGGSNDKFFGDFAHTLQGRSGFGPALVQIIAALASIAAACVLWLEMALRTAILYVGAALGPIVYTGLVNKQLWPKVRRWAGLMGAIIMAKPIMVIVLMLASAISNTQTGTSSELSTIVSGLAVIVLAIIATFAVGRFVPGMGDQIMDRQKAQRDAEAEARPAFTSAVGTLKQGISAHSDRTPQRTQPVPQQPATQAASGIAAHGSRSPEPSSTTPRARPGAELRTNHRNEP